MNGNQKMNDSRHGTGPSLRVAMVFMGALSLVLATSGCTRDAEDAAGVGASDHEASSHEESPSVADTPQQEAEASPSPEPPVQDEQGTEPREDDEKAEAPAPAHPFAHTGLMPREDFVITVADVDPQSTAFHIEFELRGDSVDAFHIDSDIFLLYDNVKLHMRGLSPRETRKDEEGRILSHRFVHSGAVEEHLRARADIPVAVLLDKDTLSQPAVWEHGPFEPVD